MGSPSRSYEERRHRSRSRSPYSSSSRHKRRSRSPSSRDNKKYYDDRGSSRRGRDRSSKEYRNDKRNNNNNSRDNRDKKRQQQYTWGGRSPSLNKEEEEEEEEKEAPNFGLSGKLAAETNTVNGVELKYVEPPEAAKPKQHWRLYVFKGSEQIGIYIMLRKRGKVKEGWTIYINRLFIFTFVYV